MTRRAARSRRNTPRPVRTGSRRTSRDHHTRPATGQFLVSRRVLMLRYRACSAIGHREAVGCPQAPAKTDPTALVQKVRSARSSAETRCGQATARSRRPLRVLPSRVPPPAAAKNMPLIYINAEEGQDAYLGIGHTPFSPGGTKRSPPDAHSAPANSTSAASRNVHEDKQMHLSLYKGVLEIYILAATAGRGCRAGEACPATRESNPTPEQRKGSNQ